MLGARRTDRLEKLTAEVVAAGRIAQFRSLDVTNRPDFEAFIVATQQAFGHFVDIVGEISN